MLPCDHSGAGLEFVQFPNVVRQAFKLTVVAAHSPSCGEHRLAGECYQGPQIWTEQSLGGPGADQRVPPKAASARGFLHRPHGRPEIQSPRCPCFPFPHAPEAGERFRCSVQRKAFKFPSGNLSSVWRDHNECTTAESFRVKSAAARHDHLVARTCFRQYQ